MARFNGVLTVTSGTPQNLGTGLTTSDGIQRFASRVFIQMVTAGSGLGYVMAGILGTRVPATSNSSDVTMELSAASADGPGGWYSDFDPNFMGGGIDVTTIWVDGANTGDTIRYSYDLRV